MSLGNALLQPSVFSRDIEDPIVGLVEDITRLIAIFGEDAVAGGPMAAQAEAAVDEVGQTVVAWFTAEGNDGQTRQARVTAKLVSRFTPIRAIIDGLLSDTSALAADPSLIVGLVRQLLGIAKGITEGATLSAIRTELNFVKSLIEDDLGFSPSFVNDRITEFATVLNRLLGELASPADAAARRRINLARAVLSRLSLRSHLLMPPELDVEPLARTLHRVLKSSGMSDAMREAGCALDGMEQALNAAVVAGEAVSVTPQPVNAGVVPRPDKAEYSYFASWLLNDELIPMLGLSDLDKQLDFLNDFRDSDNRIIAALRAELSEDLRTRLAAYGGGSSEKEFRLELLAAINKQIQTGPILNLGDGNLVEEDDLTDEIKKLRDNYREDQKLFIYNRRVVELAFGDSLNSIGEGAGKDFWIWLVTHVGYPRNQVFVSGDRKFVMCDDVPLHFGKDVKWNEAPMFANSISGGMWFSFEHASAEFCEKWAQVISVLGETVKAAWHMLMIQPGHEAQNATVCSIEYADAIQQFLFGKPISAHLLEEDDFVRGIGKLLDSAFGLKGLATMLSTLQGQQSLDTNESGLYWLTVFGGDFFRTLTPIFWVNKGTDILIGFVALLNFGGPRLGPSTLPSNPARNHHKQHPFVGLSDSLFLIWLVSMYPRDNYSIGIWSSGAAGVAADRENAMAVHWLVGGVGMGLAAGLTGSWVAMVVAWAEDFKRFFVTGAWSALRVFLQYWFYNYKFVENATDDGRYTGIAAPAVFRGYPDNASSPYRLPYPSGTSLYCGQGNLGLFSHNRISSLTAPTQQVYSYDFSHDFRGPISCCRSGTVFAAIDSVGDSLVGVGNGDGGTWNFITIQHDTIDPVHDDFGNGPVQTYSVYGHLAQNGIVNAPFFAPMGFPTQPPIPGTPPTPLPLPVHPAVGLAVAQGDQIAQGGDTGTSFHNHLHMHVVPDDGTGQPGNFTIPFVFREARNGLLPSNGNLQSTTWYRSRNPT